MTNTMAKVTVGALFVIAACDSARKSAELATFRDSAGIRIVENVSPDDSAAHVWWRIGEPEVDIGGADAVEPYALYRVNGAIRQPDGSIVVASSVSADVRVFSATGEHVRTTGRKGGGPGEFQSVSWIDRASGDSILIYDGFSRRLTVLDPAAGFVRVISPEQETAPARVYGQFASGDLLVAGSVIGLPDELPRNEITRVPTHIGRFSIGSAKTDSLGVFAGPERIIQVNTQGGEIQSIQLFSPPFVKVPSFAVGPDEFYFGSQDGPEIQIFDTTATLRRLIRTGRVPETVTQAHLDAAFERRLGRMPEAARSQMRASGPPDQPHGEFVPPYADLLVDRAGNLWVADYADPLDAAGRWTVYGPDGAVISRIALPENFRPFDIGLDYVLGRELDELDTEHIRLYPLIKS